MEEKPTTEGKRELFPLPLYVEKGEKGGTETATDPVR